MFNIEQELELCGNGYSPEQFEVRDPRIEGDKIFVDLRRNGRHYASDWHFNAKTGVYFDQQCIDNPTRLRPKSETRPVTSYFLFVGQSDWDKDQWVKVQQEMFSDGRTAAERMKTHNGLFTTTMSPFRVMVKPETKLSEVRDYPAWAEFRYSSGEWVKTPWESEPWANKYPEHHAHLSVEDPCQIAFWPNEASAQLDQVTVLPPGKYLAKYFSDELTPTEIQKWAVKVDVECELKFAKTPEEIVEVYSHPNSPSSCMRYRDDYSGWQGGMNPTRVYGAGDLAIAYLERKNKIVARGICWPEKKIFGRLYGDTDRMITQLKAAGFTEDQSEHSASARGNGGFVGARLLKIPYDDFYVMPYIDAGYGVKPHPTDDNLFVMTRGDGTICCTYTNGLSGDPDEEPDYEYYCEACGDGLYEDDAYHIQDWGYYCHIHYDHYAVNCHHCDTSIHRDDSYTVDDEEYCRSCRNEHTHECEYCEERTSETLTPVYDARYDVTTGPSDVTLNVCSGCADQEYGATDRIRTDINGNLIDTETATQCEHDDCGAYFSGDLSSDECPIQICVDRRANDNQTEEMETAA